MPTGILDLTPEQQAMIQEIGLGDGSGVDPMDSMSWRRQANLISFMDPPLTESETATVRAGTMTGDLRERVLDMQDQKATEWAELVRDTNLSPGERMQADFIDMANGSITEKDYQAKVASSGLDPKIKEAWGVKGGTQVRELVTNTEGNTGTIKYNDENRVMRPSDAGQVGNYHLTKREGAGPNIEMLGSIALMVAMPYAAPALATSLGVSNAVATGLISAAAAGAKGGSTEDIIKAAALSYVTSSMGETGTVANKIATNVKGTVMGLVPEAIKNSASMLNILPPEIMGFVKDTMKSTIINGGDVKAAVISTLITNGVELTHGAIDDVIAGTQDQLALDNPAFGYSSEENQAFFEEIDADATQDAIDANAATAAGDTFNRDGTPTFDEIDAEGRPNQDFAWQPVDDTSDQLPTRDNPPQVQIPDYQGLLEQRREEEGGYVAGSEGLGDALQPEEEAPTEESPGGILDTVLPVALGLGLLDRPTDNNDNWQFGQLKQNRVETGIQPPDYGDVEQRSLLQIPERGVVAPSVIAAANSGQPSYEEWLKDPQIQEGLLPYLEQKKTSGGLI